MTTIQQHVGELTDRLAKQTEELLLAARGTDQLPSFSFERTGSSQLLVHLRNTADAPIYDAEFSLKQFYGKDRLVVVERSTRILPGTMRSFGPYPVELKATQFFYFHLQTRNAELNLHIALWMGDVELYVATRTEDKRVEVDAGFPGLDARLPLSPFRF